VSGAGAVGVPVQGREWDHMALKGPFQLTPLCDHCSHSAPCIGTHVHIFCIPAGKISLQTPLPSSASDWERVLSWVGEWGGETSLEGHRKNSG